LAPPVSKRVILAAIVAIRVQVTIQKVVLMLTHNIRLTTVLFSIVLVVAIIAAAVTQANAYTVTPEGIRNRMSNKLREKWDFKNLVIKVVPYQNPAYTQQGRFAAVVLSADSMTRRGKGITVREVYIKGFDVTFNVAKMYASAGFHSDDMIRSRARAVFHVKMMETDTNKLLAMKKTPVKNLHVDFGNNQLSFTGTYKLLFGNKLKMVGKLQIKDKHLLNFVPTHASVNGVPLPTGPLKQVLGKLNPLIDTYTVPLKPRIDTVTIKDTYILIKGDNA